MATLDQILDAMIAQGMPLPANNKIEADGAVHRFGPKKKAWYKLQERTLKDGGSAYYGAFGVWRGDDNGAISVTLAEGEVSEEDLADIRKRQEEQAIALEAKRQDDAKKAAGRAANQWKDAAETGQSDYLIRKQVTPEAVRFADDGVLLVPMKRYALNGSKLVGVQKIKADGSKTFNKGMEKVGAACLLGKLKPDSALLMIGEGYATCRSVRMATDDQYPAMVAFDAGNLLPVATALRRDFPDVPFLFLADDDWMLCKRLAKRLVKDFKIAATLQIDGELWPLYQSDFEDDDEVDKQLIAILEKGASRVLTVATDGSETKLLNDAGEQVRVVASWYEDANGINYIKAEVSCGRVNKTYTLENAGMAKASAVAKVVGNAYVWKPAFVDRGQRKLTDWNDLHCEQGLDAVRDQLAGMLLHIVSCLDQPADDVPELPPFPIDDACGDLPESDAAAPAGGLHLAVDNTKPPQPEYGEEAPAAAPAEAGGGAGGKKPPKKVYPKEFWEKVDYLLENYVLIYGTEDAWDNDNRMILRVAHMRLAHGNDAVKFWLGNGSRKMVNKDRVVFDPTMTCDPETSVNLYHGFDMMPKPGKHQNILLLLDHLCGGNEDVFEWVLNWLAYPLQNKGAKMRTSIIVHGDEGSGKNLFFENVIKRIYGEYGGVIGNAQIESQFNEWASRKLYFVADEVVTRNELRQLKGKLKHMITGETIMINPKNMTERSEANHMNFVFLSNELQPLALDKTDRRYLVIWTPPNKPPEFYKDVADEIAAGGAESFLDFLLKLDLGDFNEHTKPLNTEAKVKLIGLGLTPSEKFYREWSLGFLPLPYMTCSAQQLYTGFLRWCHLNGEKFPPTQTLFGRMIERTGFGQLSRAVIKFDLGTVCKQRTVYLVGDMPEGSSRKDWAEQASSLFEKCLKQYRHVHDQPMDLATDVHGQQESVNS
ncbi:DUF5906 domain-containing protein [Oxalicibacterium faecigallinarum]|uniref:NrS-1 polymerase-like helicase domain-containing protein n=1 Tax=Oxalicibacterium faecigallinarum TaxID=573741 RepID=A0A8J3F0Y3_9BURK|nr:DUF5906 domain-containing protein [Oxalicibacterium faecigallinarum]GGI16414.1 hypothetical protein GCM10008066_03840 [Oxalicibacterium faecigallinarum]